MTYTQIYALGSRQSLLTKTAVAITVAASAVLAGTKGTATQGHKNNAKVTLQNPMNMALSFIWYVVNDATVQAEEEALADSATDAHVQAVVDANWSNIWA